MFYNVTITGDNVLLTGAITTGMRVTGTLALNNAGTTNGTKLNENHRFFINRMTTNGSLGNLARLYSRTVSTAAILEKGSGKIDIDYLNLKDVHARGGAPFFAKSNVTNGGNNTGWQFSNNGYKQSGSDAFMPLVSMLTLYCIIRP